jgi:hypothetical protein
MHKSTILTFGLLMSSLVMLSAIPLLNNNNNVAMAQGYYNNNYGDSSNSYSQYPTDDKKYECQKGPFEGFFVSSVEFCKHVKFDKDDRKDDRDNKTGQQGPQGPIGQAGPQGPAGPPGAQGPAGPPGANGIQGQPGANGTQGQPGANGTDIDPCVACLLDALAKLDSGAILVNVTASIERPPIGPLGNLNITLPLVIDVDVATLLQSQLATQLQLNANATIFEICAAIDVQDLDIDALLSSLALTLDPIVEDQISQSVLQIGAALDALGIQVTPTLLATIIASIDIDAIVADIIANVEVSLGILEECLGLEPTPPITATLTVNKEVFGCNNFIIGNDVMDCSQMTNTDPAWLPCTGSTISNSPPCLELTANLFDIEVLDDQNNRILSPFEGSAQGTTIENLQPGTYAVNEIKNNQSNINQLGESLNDETTCGVLGFDDGGTLLNTNADPDLLYTICIEYEDEQGNDCSTLTLAGGEDKTCMVKNYIRFTNIQL